MSNFKDVSVVLRGLKRLLDGHVDYRYQKCCSNWCNSSVKGVVEGTKWKFEKALSQFISTNTRYNPFDNYETSDEHTDNSNFSTQIHDNLDPKNENSTPINEELHPKNENLGTKSNKSSNKNPNLTAKSPFSGDKKLFSTTTNHLKSISNHNKVVLKRYYTQKSDQKSEKPPKNPTADSFSNHEISRDSKESKVPGSRIERLIGFGGLGASLAFDALSNKALSGLGLKEKNDKGGAILDNNPLLSDASAERIVKTLCRMRGAALKIGQMLSIQDNSFISPSLARIFERVRQSADFMPVSQMESVMVKELGEDWRGKFEEFSNKPFAAASIGQVHRGVDKSGRLVAVKIQYPGVASSINSDINNLVTLLRISNILPEGMYAQSALKIAKRELAWECDYAREARACEKFRSLVKDDPFLYVPEVMWDLSTKEVLTTEMVRGVPLDDLASKDAELRNNVSSSMLELCLREVFTFQFMQTDPNWSNFLYDDVTNKVSLIDFGASRGFESRFTGPYLELIMAASKGDKPTVLQKSKEMKFMTGFESKVMEDAHVDAVMILGEAFSKSEPFDFGGQSTAKRIHSLIPVMLKHRLSPPPEETYSLHRKMAGCFLLCSKLGAKINCQPMFYRVYEEYMKRVNGGGGGGGK